MRNKTFESMGTVISLSFDEDISDSALQTILDGVYAIFHEYDELFSTYKETSLISKINNGTKEPLEISDDALAVFALAEEYRQKTNGYFDLISPTGKTDPSGIVKAYALERAGRFIDNQGYGQWCLNAGGDIVSSASKAGWNAGIVDPSRPGEILSVVSLESSFRALATSGFSERGEHIWNPMGDYVSDALQVSVVGNDIIFADVMATALIAAGSGYLEWIENEPDAEALIIRRDGTVVVTSGYLNLVAN